MKEREEKPRRRRLKTGGAGKAERRHLAEEPSGSKLRVGRLRDETRTISLREFTLTSFFYGESKRKDERNREERSRQRRGEGEMALEKASETSLLRLSLAPQPSPTKGPRGQDVSQRRRVAGPEIQASHDRGLSTCPAPRSRGLRASHLEHLDHILTVALLSQVTQLGRDVYAATDVHIDLHGLFLDLGVQLCQVLYQEHREGSVRRCSAPSAGTDKTSAGSSSFVAHHCPLLHKVPDLLDQRPFPRGPILHCACPQSSS